MTPLETIRAIRELIGAPERWTTGDYARTANGDGCMGTDPDATCWCMLGAVQRVVQDDYAGFLATGEYGSVTDILYTLMFRDHEDSIVAWQDQQDHATVIAWLDKIIAELEAEAAA